MEHRSSPPFLVELDAGHPSDVAPDNRCHDDRLKMADVSAGEDERPTPIDAFLVEHDLTDALELDEVAHEATGPVESRAHGREWLGDASLGQGHGGGLVQLAGQWRSLVLGFALNGSTKHVKR